MAPRRLLGGWYRRRPTARPLTVGAAARRPCDFRWTASPPLNNPAIPNGRRLTAQQPRDSQRTAFRRPTVLHPPLADVVDTTRRPFDPPQRTPTSLSLVVPVVPASVLPAPCVSLLPRRTAPCQLRVKRRAMYSAVPGHGNKSPSCIPQGASDRKKDTSRQYIAAMYSDKANHGKN